MVRTEPVPTPNCSIASSAVCAQPRMRRQAEVVVRRQIDDRAVVERGVRLLLVVEDAQVPIEVLLLERVELVAQVGERVLTHRGSISFGFGARGSGFGALVRIVELRRSTILRLRPALANPEPRPCDYFGVSRELIHSVNSTCRMAAVGTARIAPTIRAACRRSAARRSP